MFLSGGDRDDLGDGRTETAIDPISLGPVVRWEQV